MTVKSEALIASQFTVQAASGALVNADALPTGTLVIAGADNGAVVTVANLSTGRYSQSVTCPALTAGQTVQVRINCAVATVALGGFVYNDMADADVLADAMHDEVVDSTYTLRQLLRGFASVLLGKSANSGADYRDLADSKYRVDSTLDDDGNRTAISLDLT